MEIQKDPERVFYSRNSCWCI